MQLIGLATITAVVFIFFINQMSMEPLLIWSLAGVLEFYGGTWLLGRQEE